MEGDTTNFYIFRKLQEIEIKITLISRGIGVGNQLEYIDELTLGKSLLDRSVYKTNLYN
jgi:recombination protein RecR